MAKPPKTNKDRAPERPPMSESGALLHSFLPIDVLDHRLNALLWSVLLGVACKCVAILRMVRHERILDLSEARREEKEWPATAERYMREQIGIETPSAQRFDLVLPKGAYEDDYLRAIFELRAQRGIGTRWVGPWPDRPEATVLRRPLTADEVPGIVAGALGPALSALAARVESVPRAPFVEPAEGNPDEPYSARDRRAQERLTERMRAASAEQREDARLARLAESTIAKMRHLEDLLYGRGSDLNATARQRRRRA